MYLAATWNLGLRLSRESSLFILIEYLLMFDVVPTGL